MPRNRLLIEYEHCTGCHTCEVACKQVHDYPVGKGGIQLDEIITTLMNDEIRIDYILFPTTLCDLYATRTADGQQPSCVKSYQTACMMYDDIIDIAKEMKNKPWSVIFASK